jgi:hypothetical protein
VFVPMIRSLPCAKSLPCASRLCRAFMSFAVRGRTAKTLCRAFPPLPCARAGQSFFAMCYCTAKILVCKPSATTGASLTPMGTSAGDAPQAWPPRLKKIAGTRSGRPTEEEQTSTGSTLTPKTPRWQERSREDLFLSNGVSNVMAPLPAHQKEDNTDTTTKKEKGPPASQSQINTH